MKKYLIYILKGLLVGASMLIPGVSGGTMASRQPGFTCI